MFSIVSYAVSAAQESGSPIISDSVAALLITTIVVPLALAIMRKYGLNPPSEAPTDAAPHPAPSTPPAPTEPLVLPPAMQQYLPRDVNTELMSMMTGVWNRVTVLEEREQKWEKERKEIIAHNKMLMKTNALLGKGLHTFFIWVDEGSQPPPPELSEDVRQIVKLIIEKADQEEPFDPE